MESLFIPELDGFTVDSRELAAQYAEATKIIQLNTPTWMSDWLLITRDWPLTDERFAAMGRLFHAAHAEGRARERKGVPMRTEPAYRVPDTGPTV